MIMHFNERASGLQCTGARVGAYRHTLKRTFIYPPFVFTKIQSHASFAISILKKLLPYLFGSLVPMDGPGTITWEEFLENAESFVQMSNQFSDGWELRGNKTIPGETYIIRQRKQFISSNSDFKDYSTLENNEFTDDLNFVLKHDPFEASSSIEKPLVTEHHVLWSMSYGVPVLYFNGWKSDFPGINPISIEEAQAVMQGAGLKYAELSQAIHPILDTPFLYLHPCMSQELLQITGTSKNKLISWLSTVAPAALGLKLRSEYCKLTL